MKTRMVVYFLLGVLIGLGYPAWAQLFMGGFDHVHRGLLWGLVTLTVALALISMSLRLHERMVERDAADRRSREARRARSSPL
jgi:hypothetical protein